MALSSFSGTVSGEIFHFCLPSFSVKLTLPECQATHLSYSDYTTFPL